MGKLNRQLRVGVLLDSFEIPAWQYQMLKEITYSEYAEIVLGVLNTSSDPSQKPKRPVIFRIIKHWNSLFYIAYQKFEGLFTVSPDAFEIKDVNNLFVEVPILKVLPKRTRYSDYIADKDIGEIQKYSIDVFIRLGFRILRGKILQAAKFGVWSYHHADNRVNRGGPAGFWEVFEQHAITGSILQILSEDLDNGIVLYRSYSATCNSLWLPVRRNRNNFYWKTLSFLPRKLRELHHLGEQQFFAGIKAENRQPHFYSNRLYKNPTNFQFLKLFLKHALRYIISKLHFYLFLEQWVLLFDLHEGISTSLWRFKKIIPPKDRFWADPYIIYKDNQYYIFLEEFTSVKNKGHISLLTMDETGQYALPVKILERPYHLSYPFVFEWHQQFYMLVESVDNRTIDSYKCLEFPMKWEFHKPLLKNIMAVDPTLFYDQQKWWLFATIVEYEGASPYDELFLFYADTPVSDRWTPHPHNPIVSDVRRARPAGKIFQYNGKLYRPSQDCSNRYGYSVKINQILHMDEKDYKEQEVSSIEPNWEKDLLGVHTFNHEHHLTIIDGALRRFKFF